MLHMLRMLLVILQNMIILLFMSHVSQTTFDTELKILHITCILRIMLHFKFHIIIFSKYHVVHLKNWNVTFYVTYVTNDITYASGFLTSQWMPAYGGIQSHVKAKGWSLVQVPQSLQNPGLRNPQLNHGAAINKIRINVTN